MSRLHGTRAKYVIDKCRCDECRRANREYRALADRQIAYGRWEPYADASQTRAHIEELRHAGMGLRQIAKASGVGRTALTKIATGERRKVRTETAQSILEVVPFPAGHTLISSEPTQRRIALLLAAGWTQCRIAQAARWSPQNFNTLYRRSEQVTRHTALKILAIYADHLASNSAATDDAYSGDWVKGRDGIMRKADS